MKRILIVDDEQIITKGIKHLIQYSAIDISEIFTAINGYEALDIIRTNEIDLIITDIQMEGMTGLDLMREAKLLYPWIEVIVISAFEDFDYAQKAIQLGAKDYLIKPINTEHLINSVRNCLLNKSFKNTTTLDPPTSSEQSKWECISKDEFPLIFEDHSSERSERYHIVIQVKADKELMKQQLLEEVISIFASFFDYSFEIKGYFEDKILIIVSWDKLNHSLFNYSETEIITSFIRNWQYKVSNDYSISLVIGYSQILKGSHLVKELIRQTDKVLDLHKIDSNNRLYYYGDYNWHLYSDKDENVNFVNEKNHQINKVKKFIKQNYRDPNLSLTQIAENNHLSSNYLSALFKQETNENVWDFVIKLRMEESKYLLLNTDMKSYEIAHHIGYESSDHFSRTFKKYFGQSPTKMRKSDQSHPPGNKI